ncbi:hypothetical protein, partial [Enterobacter intestinihominis]
GASTIVRNTFPARSSVFCATARCKSAPPPGPLPKPAMEKLFFTYNPGRVMNLSYNRPFMPEPTHILCYNSPSFIEWTPF